MKYAYFIFDDKKYMHPKGVVFRMEETRQTLSFLFLCQNAKNGGERKG
jgi:hypothetical protein